MNTRDSQKAKLLSGHDEIGNPNRQLNISETGENLDRLKSYFVQRQTSEAKTPQLSPGTCLNLEPKLKTEFLHSGVKLMDEAKANKENVSPYVIINQTGYRIEVKEKMILDILKDDYEHICESKFNPRSQEQPEYREAIYVDSGDLSYLKITDNEPKILCHDSKKIRRSKSMKIFDVKQFEAVG